MSHALVVGGTGMLAPVTHRLAGRFETVSVVARSFQDFLEPPFNRIVCDYQETAQFHGAVDAAVDRFGPIEHVVAWFHHIQPALKLGAHLNSRCRFLHLVGSSAGDPNIDFENRIALLRNSEKLEYQLIVLGFQIGDDGSRWLTHEEICDGVLKAEESQEPTTIIGTLAPWEMRP